MGSLGSAWALLAGKQQIFTLELLVLSDEVAQRARSVLGDWWCAHVQLFREGASVAAFQRKSGLRRASLIEGKLGLERVGIKVLSSKGCSGFRVLNREALNLVNRKGACQISLCLRVALLLACQRRKVFQNISS